MYQKPTKVTQHMVESNVKYKRMLEEQTRDYISFSQESEKLNTRAKAEARFEKTRRANEQARIAAGQMFEQQVRRRKKDETQANRTFDQNRTLALELDKRELEAQRKELEIQRICDNSDELKTLEKHLQIAYLNKERATQHHEKLAIDRMLREQEIAMEDQMEYDRQEYLQREQEKIVEEREKHLKMQELLAIQIEERQRRQEEAELDAEKEKVMVDELVERIALEEYGKREREIMERKKVEEEVVHHEQLRQQLLKIKEAEEDEEMRKIEEYAENMERRKREKEENIKAKKEEGDRAYQEVVKQTEARKGEEEEFEKLRDMLWEEELEKKKIQIDEEKARKEYDLRVELTEANRIMMEQKNKQRDLDLQEEVKFINAMKTKFADDEQRERDLAQKKREDRLEYIRQVNEQRSERKEMFEKEIEGEVMEAEKEREKEEFRQKVVEEARKRLLEEHARKLAGFLMPGTLKDEAEIQLVHGK